MFKFSKLAFVGLTLGAGLIVSGCATNDSPPKSTLVTGEQGVLCSKCQVTYVRDPRSQGGAVAYRTRKVMECPDCKDAVSNFFATGKLQHTCKTCGDTMEICEKH